MELEQDPVQILQALLRASRCLPRDVTLLEDMQQVWHTTDCQASLSELEKREPERHAVRMLMTSACSFCKMSFERLHLTIRNSLFMSDPVGIAATVVA